VQSGIAANKLKRANEILRKASAFFAAAELDRLTK
jgi:transposase-like protein